MDNQPQPINQLSQRELTKLAKQRGALTYRLMRASLIGWVAFGITLIALIAALAFIALKPSPVLVVNQQGELVASINWLETAARSNEAIALAVRQFIINKNAVNANTVREQRVAALNMMAAELQNKLAIQEGYAIQEFINNNNHGYVKITDIAQLQRSGNQASYQVAGEIVLTAANRKHTSEFVQVVDITITSRTPANPTGIIINNIR